MLGYKLYILEREFTMRAALIISLACTLLFNTPSASAESTSLNAVAYTQKLSLHGISFDISSSGNTLRIVPSGLKKDNSHIEHTIDGVVTGADIGDINVDKSPEIYIKTKDNISLIAYSANKNKSLSEIYLPPFTDDPKLAKGYRSHNEIALV